MAQEPTSTASSAEGPPEVSSRSDILRYLGSVGWAEHKETDVGANLHRFPGTGIASGRGYGRIAATRRLSDLAHGMPAPPVSHPRADIRTTHRYDGVVVGIDWDDGIFEAKLSDGESHTTWVADFLLDEVDEDDRELVKVGALFYATVGRVRLAEKRWQTTSGLTFRRIPPPRSEDVAAAVERGAKLRSKLSGD